STISPSRLTHYMICSFMETCESGKRRSSNSPREAEKVATRFARRLNKLTTNWRGYTVSGEWDNSYVKTPNTATTCWNCLTTPTMKLSPRRQRCLATKRLKRPGNRLHHFSSTKTLV